MFRANFPLRPTLRRAVAGVLLLLSLILPLAACTPEPRVYQMEFSGYMDTVSQLTMPAETQGAFREVAAYFEERLSYYDRLYTAYEEVPGVTNLWAVNRRAGEGPVEVPEDLMALLLFGRNLAEASDGALSITLGAVTELWHRAISDAHYQPDEAAIPDDEVLDEALTHTSPDDLLLDEEAGTVTFRDPGLRLDLGAVAKGYAAERLAEDLEEQGVRSALINLGGNIRTIGWKDEDEEIPWVLAVQNPVRRLRESLDALLEGELEPETEPGEPTAPLTEATETEATEGEGNPETETSTTTTSTYATMPYLTLPTKPSPPPIDVTEEGREAGAEEGTEEESGSLPGTAPADYGPRKVKGLTDPVHINGSPEYVTVVSGHDWALVTSGIYERYLVADGYLYHHVLDPETGRPAQRYQSVTILTRDAGLADVLSTALMNLSLEDGAALIRRYPETYAIWVDMEGYMYRSPGMRKMEMDPDEVTAG